jgi:hypothetical protein
MPFTLTRSVFNQGSLLFGYWFKGARDLIKLPVATGETIVRGMLVGKDGSDEAIEATDAAGYTFVGVAAANPHRGFVYVWQKGFYKFTATNILNVAIGTQLYVATSTTVDDASSNNVKVGRLVKNLSQTKGWLELNVDEV